MNGPELLTRLNMLCDPDGRKDYLRCPLRLSDGWVVATNGRGILYLRAEGLELPQADPETAKKVGQFLAPHTDEATMVSLERLRHWLGQAFWPQPCQLCASEGCDVCEGEGTIFPASRPGWIYGILINRNLMAQFLEHVEAPTNGPHAGLVALRYPKVPANTVNIPPVYVDAPGWRVVVMPMRPDAADQLNERFPETQP